MEPTDRSSHWNTYYTGKDVPLNPSQFAVFTVGEFAPDAIVDVGCGSGRDTFFFGGQGIFAIGVDGSQAAVDLCQSRINGRPLAFVCSDINNPNLPSLILPLLGDAAKVLIYARFFIHAITEDEEANFLQHCIKILHKRGGHVALEFRTPRDRSLHKVTPDHYRRFVDPASLIGRAARLGLVSRYSVEGFGMAKYKDDDAYVSRILLSYEGN